MRLPFTIEQFLDVFRRYNTAVWPMQWILVSLALVAIALALRDRPNGNRVVSAILAALWLWMALAYHLTFFAGVNRAAIGFAVLFVAQAALFAWLALALHRSPTVHGPSEMESLEGSSWPTRWSFIRRSVSSWVTPTRSHRRSACPARPPSSRSASRCGLRVSLGRF